MTQLDPERYYAQIEASTAAIAGLVDGADLTTPIPTCPEWTLRQLATHVGRAPAVGRRRSSAPGRPSSSRSARCPTAGCPTTPRRTRPGWPRAREQLDRGRAGGRRRTGCGRSAAWRPAPLLGPADVPRDGGARGRRAAGRRAAGQHRAGRGRRRDRRVADRAHRPGGGPSPTARAAALPAGRSLHVHATDEGLDGAGEWLLSHEPDGVRRGPGPRQGRRGRDRAGRPAAAGAAAPGCRPTTRR